MSNIKRPSASPSSSRLKAWRWFASRFPTSTEFCAARRSSPQEAIATLRSGCTITTTVLAKDTSHRTVFPVFTPGGGFGMREMEGGADVLMVADPTTFRLLPWAANTGWVLCDLYFSNGKPVPFATRGLYRNVLGDLAQRGYDFVAGLEVEFHIFKLDDAKMDPAHAGQPGEPPSVSLLSQGYQYLTEQRYDQMEGRARNHPARCAQAGAAAAVGRSRVRAEPVRVHLCADDRPRPG